MRTNQFRVLVCGPCLMVSLLTGCQEQEREIREQTDRISQAIEAKRATEQKIKQSEGELAQLRKANREEQAFRNENKAKSAKSEAGAKLATQFRADLEVSLQRYAKEISTYREKYLAP